MTAHPWSGGFRTLEEEHSYTVAEIDGDIPLALRGTLFRNGSGRNQLAGQWFVHQRHHAGHHVHGHELADQRHLLG